MRLGQRDRRSTGPLALSTAAVLTTTLLALVINLLTEAIRLPGGRWSWFALGAVVLLLVVVLAVVEVRRQHRSDVDPSRDLAEHVNVSIQWADEEVRSVDHLGPGEQYWVVYVSNSGTKPVHEVTVFVDGGSDERLMSIRFPPLEPARRQWYILRPEETTFTVDEEAPQPWIEFTAVGERWRSVDGHLERIPV